MNAFFKSTQTARHILINLYDNYICSFTNCHHMGCIWSKVKESMFIHWSNLEHRNIQMLDILSVITWKF